MTQPELKGRILLAKHKAEGHDRAIKYVSAVLRDFGYEVIYMVYGTPAEVVKTAVEEDVHVVGLTFLNGGHMYYAPEILTLLKKKGMDDVLVVVGGIIPSEDEQELRHLGVAAVFGPGFDIQDLRHLLENRIQKLASG